MSNMNSYQRKYWYPRVASSQLGEYCRGCGISKDSDWKGHPFTGLRIDKVNNDGNHTIVDNSVEDFQLLCISCNSTKNCYRNRPDDEFDLRMTASEKKNRHAEKPLMEWLFKMLLKGDEVTWKYFVSEGSFKFDISKTTINDRYYTKYFESSSGPFELYYDVERRCDMIRFKEAFQRKMQREFDMKETPTFGDCLNMARID